MASSFNKVLIRLHLPHVVAVVVVVFVFLLLFFWGGVSNYLQKSSLMQLGDYEGIQTPDNGGVLPGFSNMS